MTADSALLPFTGIGAKDPLPPSRPFTTVVVKGGCRSTSLSRREYSLSVDEKTQPGTRPSGVK
jgi:hypothetical protein